MPTTLNTAPRTVPRVARPRPRSPVRAICCAATIPSTIATGETMKATTTETHDSVFNGASGAGACGIGPAPGIGPGPCGTGPKPRGGDGGAA